MFINIHTEMDVGIEATKKQHNFLGGLVSGTTPDVKELVGEEDFGGNSKIYIH